MSHVKIPTPKDFSGICSGNLPLLLEIWHVLESHMNISVMVKDT